jgi:hypothetical protein
MAEVRWPGALAGPGPSLLISLISPISSGSPISPISPISIEA